MAIVVPPQMLDRLRENESRFDRITEELGQPAIISDRKKFSDISKERAALEKIVNAYRDFLKNYNEYKGAVEILENEKDPDLVAMAKADIIELEPVVAKQSDELQFMLLPVDPRDEKNAVL